MAQHRVKVYARECDGQVVFQPSSHLWRTSPKFPEGRFVFSKDEIMNMKKSDKHHIEFKLVDQTKRDLEFPEDPKDAMWVMPAVNVNDCPKNRQDEHYGVLTPVRVDSDSDGKGRRNILWVTNANSSEENWAFCLNFKQNKAPKGEEGKMACWDPITQNQNGGMS